jgi:4-hydroxybenzoyl-CoA reductase subunit beta
MKREAGPNSQYVAGGTDLFPNMKRRHEEPKTVISLGAVESLREISVSGNGEVSVGAGLTLTAVATHAQLRNGHTVVAQAAELVSTPLLRNMGTLGGNLCLDTRCNYYNQSYEWRKSIDFCMKKDGAICWVAPSSPRCWAVSSSDIAPVMVALDARYTLVGNDGERQIRAEQFYHDDGIEFLTKRPDEILLSVQLPAPNEWDATYLKLRRRGSFDFPVLGVAAYVQWDAGQVSEARIVLGGVASYPKTIYETGQLLVGTTLDDDAIAAAAQAAFKPAKPMDNTDFGLAWRKEMTRTYVKRALEELRSRREGF